MNLNLSINLLRRDWRAGEWRVLFIALVLAVGSISTVGLFADRVRLALQQEASSLLGADLRIVATHSLPPAYRIEAQRRGLSVIEGAVFPSMVAHEEKNVLSEIQAVEDGYPLRGKIEINDGFSSLVKGRREMDSTQALGSSSVVVGAIPARGSLWADARLMQRMGLKLGDVVNIGALHLRLAARIVRDVDQSVGFASFAPRVLINAADLPASGLIQQGSRINYRMLFAGEAAQISGFRDWLQQRLTVGEKLEGVRDARPEIRVALERAEHFLGLAALTAALLAGVALALAARNFVNRHLDACAMMRCLGASQAQILRIFLAQFLLLGLFAVMLGGLCGYAVQAALVQSIATMREAALPSPGWVPLWQAAASGLALLLGFTFLPLWQLKSVTPLRVIRRELGTPEASTGLLYASGGAVLCGLFLWQAGSLKLGLIVLAGLAGGLLLFGGLAWVAVRALAKFGGRAFANMARHGRSNALQIIALSLGGTALLLLTFVRADLMENWRGRLPPDAPNYFIVNIQPDQRDALNNFFAQRNVPAPQLFPMVRGRLIAINQRAVSGQDYAEPRARALVEREFNLSWSENLPTGNELVQGKWFEHGATSVLSVEEGIAQTLGIHLGDSLTYDVAGSQFSAQVVNLRKVQWDSMQVNFFVIAAPGILENLSASYLTSFHLPADKTHVGDALIKTFPNLLLVDTRAVIEQVRHIVDQIAQAMSAVFLFTLFSGLAVLYAALLATQDERIHHTAILRTLGADSRYLRKLHLTEFAALGALSGLFAATGATLLGWALAHFVLEIPYHPSILPWPVAMSSGVVVVMLVGWLVTRRVVKMSPLRVLQSV